MKFCISNIALSPFDHLDELRQLPELGLTGLEVAPSRIWKDTWQGLSAADVASYRKQVEAAGLSVVGLHSLFFDHPDLGLFKGADVDAATIDFLIHLSAVCRDLGGRTLIWGGGRKRGEVTMAQATENTIRLIEAVLPTLERDGTCLCFEPLGPKDTDFLNSVFEIIPLVERFASPGFRLQLDAKALMENEEAALATFEAARPLLVHFHANEPGLGVIGSSRMVPHTDFGEWLTKIAYGGYVSIEQRMINADTPLTDVSASADMLHVAYGDAR